VFHFTADFVKFFLGFEKVIFVEVSHSCLKDRHIDAPNKLPIWQCLSVLGVLF
jgi:hypothetical protein